MRRSYISLGAGIVLALLAILAVRLYVGAATRGAHEPDGAFTQIAVVDKDMPSGTVLTESAVHLVRWPVDSVPDGSFNSIDAIFKGAKSKDDRVVLTAMVRGEPVLRSKVTGLGARPILSSMVTDGMRAMSIQINDVSGVAGFILPGDHVDIMLTRRLDTSNTNLVTDTILQNVKVLGIDQLATTDTNKPVVGRTATVEVSPDQAGKLALAQQAGTLSLALRNSSTVENAAVSRVSESDLTSGRRPEPARVARRASADTVQVQYGVPDSRTASR